MPDALAADAGMAHPLLEVAVDVFSAHPLTIAFMLNRGQTVTVPGVALDWKPSTPSAGPSLGFDNGGASANNFGYGDNTVQVQVGSGLIYTVTMKVTNGSPVSLQLYFFADGASGSVAHWVLLAAGEVMDTDLVPPSSRDQVPPKS